MTSKIYNLLYVILCVCTQPYHNFYKTVLGIKQFQ